MSAELYLEVEAELHRLTTALDAEREARKGLEARLAALESKVPAWTFKFIRNGDGQVLGIDAKKAG
jgi:hypothetical protein